MLKIKSIIFLALICLLGCRESSVELPIDKFSYKIESKYLEELKTIAHDFAKLNRFDDPWFHPIPPARGDHASFLVQYRRVEDDVEMIFESFDKDCVSGYVYSKRNVSTAKGLFHDLKSVISTKVPTSSCVKQ